MRLKIAMCWVLGLLLILAGMNHFRTPGFYLRMMPPYPTLFISIEGDLHPRRR